MSKIAASNQGYVQHGIGFVGSAVARAIHERYPDMHVCGVDVNQRAIESLCAYGIPACETADVYRYREYEVHAVSVPTPPGDGKWGYDLTTLTTTLRMLGKRVLRNTDRYKLIIIRSTVYPGTTEEVLLPTLEAASDKRCGSDFGLVYNPEFLAQATAYEDALDPPLIVCGCSDDHAYERFCSYFDRFPCSIVRLPSYKAAESCKLSNNVLNATTIALVNELRDTFESGGMENEEVDAALLALQDTAFAKTKPTYALERRGPYGGACLPKEMHAIRTAARARGITPQIVQSADEANTDMKREIDAEHEIVEDTPKKAVKH